MKTSNQNQEHAIPERPEEGLKWNSRHLRAAQLRARGWPWADVAQDVRVKKSTLHSYTQIDGWRELESHFAREIFDREIENHFYRGSLKAIRALKAEFIEADGEIADILDRLENEELDPETRSALRRQAQGISKSKVYAADRYLDALGFKKFRQRTAEIRAEVSEQGRAGTTLVHEGGDKPITHKDVDFDQAQEIYGILESLGVAGDAMSSDDAETERMGGVNPDD